MLGLLGKLLAMPYTLPKAGIGYCFDKIIEMAETEYYDDATVKEELLLLQLQLEEGEIDEMEYRRREAPILVRLREIKEHRKQQIDEMIAARKAEGAGGAVQIDLPDELR
ncbi:MAG TPA: gas vesicle protein GvpG [Candidatus Limnocylindria bacterium]|nr:gas vesicle protein GvpG [Candidatus Limnocylindria bacterium]